MGDTALLPAGAAYVCDVCHASIGGTDHIRVGKLSCWRSECPGVEPPRPSLRLVEPLHEGTPRAEDREDPSPHKERG